MLYLLIGSDTVAAKKRAVAIGKGYEVVRFGEGGETFERVTAYLGAQGLFIPKVALFLDRPSETDSGRELFQESLQEFAKAPTPVIILESELDSASKKKIPASASVETFELKRETPAAFPSVFALTDAFADGKRKDAWILYRKLIESGSVAEEIHGALSWQARSLVLASKTRNAGEAGLKPFVYSKAKRASERLGEEGSVSLSRDLVRMLHDSRMGNGNLADLLEVFLLKKA